MVVENKNTYAGITSPRITLKINAITDQVPGAFHDPIDLMNWIAQNPYVESVELIPTEDQ